MFFGVGVHIVHDIPPKYNKAGHPFARDMCACPVAIFRRHAHGQAHGHVSRADG